MSVCPWGTRDIFSVQQRGTRGEKEFFFKITSAPFFFLCLAFHYTFLFFVLSLSLSAQIICKNCRDTTNKNISNSDDTAVNG